MPKGKPTLKQNKWNDPFFRTRVLLPPGRSYPRTMNYKEAAESMNYSLPEPTSESGKYKHRHKKWQKREHLGKYE